MGSTRHRLLVVCPLKGKKEPAISRVLSWTTIHLGQPSPAASSDLPGSPLRRAVRALSPRTPLFGLAPGGVYPAAVCCHPRGALLPHLFTLAGAKALRRYVFCGTFHGLASSRRYLAPCPMEPGLSSRTLRLRRLSGRLLLSELEIIRGYGAGVHLFKIWMGAGGRRWR